MSDVAIRVEGLGKRYRRGVPAGNDRLSEVAVNLSRLALSLPRRLIGRGAPRTATTGAQPERSDEFWALKDVSFEVKQGEVVGVIGRNGAGKSTLLKILSRITEPTEGRVGLRGRVASLLEVGTGFHGELTGRENVYLSGSLLGMSRAEIAGRFDEIVAFAEVDGFLDTPVKRYSSGMLMRLAFAVAAHLESEILIVDEVLAVGDATFQKKCLGKMGQVARGGRTVLFVSHNMGAVGDLCSRAVWLEAGLVRQCGAVRSVMGRYTSGTQSEIRSRRWTPDDAPRGDRVQLREASVRPCGGDDGDAITVRTPIEVTFAFHVECGCKELNFSVVVSEQRRGCVFNTCSAAVACPGGRFRGTFTIPGDFLNNGSYTVRVLLVQDTSVALFDQSDVLLFDAHEAGRTGNWHGEWIGAVRPSLPWATETEPDGGVRSGVAP